MEYKAATAKIRHLSKKLNYMLLISVGLLISNILLIWLASWALVHQKRTIIPAEVTQQFTVSDTTVDASYLRQMALLFSTQRLNITPTNIAQNHGFLLQYTDPRFYHDFVAILNAEKQEILKQNISSVFYPEEIIPDVKKKSVSLKGVLVSWVGSLSLPPIKKHYIVTFNYNAGDLKVSSFSEKIGEV
jgi:conjugal transfer pilus assembly protein TraE